MADPSNPSHPNTSIQSDPKIIFLLENNLYTIDGTTRIPLMEGHDYDYREIVGSCNGLLLITGNKKEDIDTERLFLVNPTTQEVKILPSSWEEQDRYAGILYGLGYVEKTKDYKVVIVCYDEIYGYEPTCLVYSFKRNSWKNHVYPDKYHNAEFDVSGGVNFNGLTHWITSPSNLGEDGYTSVELVSFDFGKGKFNSLPLPPKTDDEDSEHYVLRRYELGVVRGCLSLIEGVGGEYEEGYRIWMMKEYGDENSWTNLMIEFDDERISSVPRFTIHDELIVRIEDKKQVECPGPSRGGKKGGRGLLGPRPNVRTEFTLGLYNIKEKSVKELGVSISSSEQCDDEAVEWLYVENRSLLLTNENEKQTRKGKRSIEEGTTTSDALQDNTGQKTLTLVDSKKRAFVGEVSKKARENQSDDDEAEKI